MSRTLGPRAALLLVLGLLAAGALGAVDVELGNGDRVLGTLSPGSETETFRVVVPRGALLSVSVKGKKTKGATGVPVAALRVFDPGNAEVGTALIRTAGTGAKLTKFPIDTSGEHRVVVSGDGAEGDYQLSVKWASPKKFAATPTLAGATVEVPFAADEGASATFQVKAA